MRRIDPATAAALAPWFSPDAVKDVRIVEGGPVCWFVRSVLRQGAMTVSPFVFFGRHPFDPASLDSLALLAHELKHVEQYRRYGRAGFLWRYAVALARNRLRYSPALPLEAECYDLQAEVTAALRRPPTA